jgi:hypothetical protein
LSNKKMHGLFLAFFAAPMLPFTAGNAQEALEVWRHQNAWRTLHDRAPLEWSESLAADAQAWADEVVRRRRLGMGGEHQNLAWSGGAAWDARKAPCLWFNEGNGGAHYKQMFSLLAGACGVGISRDAGFGTVVVANYNRGWGNATADIPSVCPSILKPSMRQR